MDDLTGRVAVVTGAASGLGKAMAERFAEEGMRLVVCDVEPGPLEALAAAMSDRGVEVEAVGADVSHAEDIDRLADRAFERFGAVHLLCNNAGVVKRARAWDLTLDDWRWVLGVDLWSVIFSLRAFVPRIRAQGDGGHIVNTASMAGLLAIPNLAAYGVAKAGVVSLSEALQLDLEAEGSDIGVSVLCPGFIATRITESERNRPPDLSATVATSNAPRTTSGVESTMDADDVAGQVVEAVRANRFWVLTHGRYRDILQARAAGIGADGRPAVPPIW